MWNIDFLLDGKLSCEEKKIVIFYSFLKLTREKQWKAICLHILMFFYIFFSLRGLVLLIKVPFWAVWVVAKKNLRSLWGSCYGRARIVIFIRWMCLSMRIQHTFPSSATFDVSLKAHISNDGEFCERVRGWWVPKNKSKLTHVTVELSWWFQP